MFRYPDGDVVWGEVLVGESSGDRWYLTPGDKVITLLGGETWRGPSTGLRPTPASTGWGIEHRQKAREEKENQVSVVCWKPREEYDSRRKESWSDKD